MTARKLRRSPPMRIPTPVVVAMFKLLGGNVQATSKQLGMSISAIYVRLAKAGIDTSYKNARKRQPAPTVRGGRLVAGRSASGSK